VLPSAQRHGLGTWLVGELHRQAQSLGFPECVHALMWQGSHSRRIFRPHARPLGEYVLYGRELA
jgi:GNAT superfamily N-acetyltransferase